MSSTSNNLHHSSHLRAYDNTNAVANESKKYSSMTPLGDAPTSPSLRRYFSRSFQSKITTRDLPMEKNARGFKSPAGIFFLSIKLTVPLAYVYILLILLRELCDNFHETIYINIVQNYLPHLANVVDSMQESSTFVEVWVFVEALFYICLRLHIQWLQYKDPLEACLSAAPMLELHERRDIWTKMMESNMDDPISFVTGWFFDEKLENISRYDIMDFIAWSMYEGRNQEHLTRDEAKQLNVFVDELEWRMSLYLYGNALDFTLNNKGECDTTIERRNIVFRSGEFGDLETDEEEMSLHLHLSNNISTNGIHTAPGEILPVSNASSAPYGSIRDLSDLTWNEDPKKRAKPRKNFQFQQSSHDDTPTFYSNLYENYMNRYEQYRHKLENVEFHPVQDLRHFMADKRQKIYEAEEHAMAAASHMYENAYFSVIDKGSNVDKRLTAISHATQNQLSDAWNSVRNIRESLETANFLSSRRKALQQQMKGYRMLLDRMRDMSSAVPTKQMADLMKKITQCNKSLESVEKSAMNSFINATGFARKSILHRKAPQRYAKYSYDPLLGLGTYPLMFHILILGLTDGGLRILMKKRGFERLNIGSTTYYYHPGTGRSEINEDGEEEEIPFVFCHGIGIGLIVYLPLIDEIIKSGRPILLPEIPYVSGFRPWQSINKILTPAAVSSTLTAMLASHGYLKGTFIGHSYGTSWLSYMCKYARDSISALLFIDPICFCLHHPCLTKSFVYHRADPGSVAYMVRTDVIINWTIQRSFPWARILLFTDEIPEIPCTVFLSEEDALIPAAHVENYLRSNGAHVRDFTTAIENNHFLRGPNNVTLFRGEGHGDWLESPSKMKVIARAADIITSHKP